MSVASSSVSLYDLTFEQLVALMVNDGLRPAHATTLWRALYRELELVPASRTDFLGPLRRWLESRWGTALTLTEAAVTTCIASSDGLTRKLLLRLHDAQEVETVLMGYPGRFTACVSTQAGCAMGCVFCATGQMGFVRHLTPGEILAQLIAVQRLLHPDGHALRNVVLMGMGEPFHNYDSVMQALATACRAPGMALGPSRISVSTVGVVPGIIRFTEERQPYSLAISLHAATDAERSALLPVNQRWPLADLIEACRYYIKSSGAKIFFGWTLVAGRNDTPEQAAQLASLLRGLNAHVNLIRLNATSGFSGVSTEEAAALAFQKRIQDSGIPCTIRQFRGIDVDAGCGQLRASRVSRLKPGTPDSQRKINQSETSVDTPAVTASPM